MSSMHSSVFCVRPPAQAARQLRTFAKGKCWPTTELTPWTD